jgi:hypothetical protein
MICALTYDDPVRDCLQPLPVAPYLFAPEHELLVKPYYQRPLEPVAPPRAVP